MYRILAILIMLLWPAIADAQNNDLTEPLSGIASLLPGGQQDSSNWQLVFNDEFSGDHLNTKKWKVYGEKEAFKRRDGFWTPEAVVTDGKGNLSMRTYLDSAGNYMDGCIYTEGIFETAYGYFEIRVQLHETEGHWPAFWLYSGDVFRLGKGGQDGAEIDVFEKFKINRKVEHNVHWDGYGEEHQQEGKKSRHRRIMKGFHTFGLWWAEDAYRFYVDGKQVWETTAGGVCEVPLHILISDEVGEHYRMRPIKDSQLPDEWLVDHVRVYTRKTRQ